MGKLLKITLLTGALVISGCGDEQSNQATTQTPAVTKTPAADNAAKMEKMNKMEKPAWAILEQNVYHYPE